MTKLRMAAGFIAIAASAFPGIGAEAGNNRSVVSTTGSDANNCSVPAPCRSFAQALAQTNPDGEIIVLDSGGYGPASITQGVTITAPTGVRASVFTATNINGLTINTTGNVTIEGISFLGGGNGNNGIEVDNVGTLYLAGIEVQDFLGDGILFQAGQKLYVADSVVKNCSDGLSLSAGSAYVRGSSFLNNGQFGLFFDGNAVVVDSATSFNGGAGVVSLNSTVRLLRFESVFNGGAGMFSEGTLSFDYSLSAGNDVSAFGNGRVMTGSSPGTSRLDGGGHGSTLSAATALQ